MVTEKDFPNIEGAEYLLMHLDAMGWCSSNGMGAVSISFTEIDAYNRLTGANLTADEAKIIRRMSSAYVSELNDRSSVKHAPYGEKHTAPIHGTDIAKAFASIGTVRGGKV